MISVLILSLCLFLVSAGGGPTEPSRGSERCSGSDERET